MYNITLVSTHHSELGECNSNELYKIIESIKPDIIFEELTKDLFIKFYEEDIIPYETPEIKAVKRYLRILNVKHIPVDIDVSQNLFASDGEKLFNYLKKYNAYSILEEEQIRLFSEEGYDFINSKRNEDLFTKKKITEENLISFQINKDQLSRIHKSFYEEQDQREYEIIKNIYNHSEQTLFNQGLLLLGSGHRKTIFEKIKEGKHETQVNLNWVLYGD